MKFVCSCCGIEQQEYPAICYPTPLYYYFLTQEEKDRATMDADTCVVGEGEDTFRFVRGVLVQKVNEGCQNLEYGVWVSLSEESFEDYKENGFKEGHKALYFGWLNAHLPSYELEEMERVKTNVVVNGDGNRPIVEVLYDQNVPSRFVEDYHNGITKEEAEKRIQQVMNLKS